MLPYIIGATIVGVGALLMSEAKSSNTRTRDEYIDTVQRAKSSIKSSYQKAKLADQYDKLYKMKSTKAKIADVIYCEYMVIKEQYTIINQDLYNTKISLNYLFDIKSESRDRSTKQQLQQEINLIIQIRKELFAIKQSISMHKEELYHRLRLANSETKNIQIHRYRK